jgi:hypothetical protein
VGLPENADPAALGVAATMHMRGLRARPARLPNGHRQKSVLWPQLHRVLIRVCWPWRALHGQAAIRRSVPLGPHREAVGSYHTPASLRCDPRPNFFQTIMSDPHGAGAGSVQGFLAGLNWDQADCRRRRHQPRRPPLAKIRPGRPAPAMGPGTSWPRISPPGNSLRLEDATTSPFRFIVPRFSARLRRWHRQPQVRLQTTATRSCTRARAVFAA